MNYSTEFRDKIEKTVVEDKPRRRLMFFLLSVSLSVTSMVMTIINFFTDEYVLLAATLTFSILCLVNVLLIYFLKIKEEIIYVIFGCEAMCLLAFFIISGIPQGFSALWVCLIPSFALLIFGTKGGSLFSVLALIMIVFLFWVPAGKNLLMFSYTETFMLRFPFLYTSIYIISLLIEYVRSVIQRKLESTEQEYKYLYRHDALTGLYNRYGIKEYIESISVENGRKNAAVILFDLDNFKDINDKYGHECGDMVLKEIAPIPLRIMCSHCHCCRWGGEEFLLLMQCDHNPEEIAERIRAEIEKKDFIYEGKKINVTASMGVAIADDIGKISVRELTDYADKAMYNSKYNGKNQVTVTHVSKS